MKKLYKVKEEDLQVFDVVEDLSEAIVKTNAGVYLKDDLSLTPHGAYVKRITELKERIQQDKENLDLLINRVIETARKIERLYGRSEETRDV